MTTTDTQPYNPTALVTIRGGILRGSTMPRSKNGRLHLYTSGPIYRGPDLFLTPTEAKQWATTLALASALAADDDEGDEPVEGMVTRDPLTDMIARWRGEAAVAREQASIDADCNDHSGVARNSARADAIAELLRELEAVIGL